MSRLFLVLGVAAFVVAGALALASRPAQDVGTALVVPTPDPSPSSSSPPGADVADHADDDVAPSPPASPPPVTPGVTTRSARLADVTTAPAPAPQRLRIPAIGVDAPVGPVGVEPDGQMTVPTDVAEIGWYRHGPVPGATGSAVLAGHVDSRTQGRGAFFSLDRLAPGDEVEVTDAAGDTTTWVVTGRQTIDKDVLPLEEVFRRDGPARLVLVTCGGDFDGSARSYRSNVVVTAEPRSS